LFNHSHLQDLPVLEKLPPIYDGGAAEVIQWKNSEVMNKDISRHYMGRVTIPPPP
jgi:hypothetical protein